MLGGKRSAAVAGEVDIEEPSIALLQARPHAFVQDMEVDWIGLGRYECGSVSVVISGAGRVNDR